VLELHENFIESAHMESAHMESAHVDSCMCFVLYEIPFTNFPSQSVEFPRISNNCKGGLPQAVPRALLQHSEITSNNYKGGLPQVVLHALLQHSEITSNNYKGGLPQVVLRALLQHSEITSNNYKGGLPQAVPQALLQHSPMENGMHAERASLSGSPQHDRGRRPTWWTKGISVYLASKWAFNEEFISSLLHRTFEKRSWEFYDKFIGVLCMYF
jgi:hypothetical protein